MSESMNVSAMLTEQIDRVFGRMVTRDMIDAAEAGSLSQELWTELENIGVMDAITAEDLGGAGISWLEAEPVLHAIGFHAAPVPLGETMIGRSVLAAAGLEVPSGPLAIAEKVFNLDSSGRLSGADPLVPWAQQAGNIVAVAVRGNETFLCRLRWEDLTGCSSLDFRATTARIPGAKLNLNGAQPAQTAPANLGTLGLLPHIALLRAAQISGSLDRVLALCIEYGNMRVQFGKPIGKFQVIQHMTAELAELGAAAQVAAQYGCRKMDRNEAEYGAAIAKIRTSMSSARSAALAHQIFGAIGVTDEHFLHFLTRRLWQWRNEGGSEHWWAEWLGRRTIAAGGENLWPTITG